MGRRKEISGYKKCEVCPVEFPFRSTLLVRSKNGVASAKQRFCSWGCRNNWLAKENHSREFTQEQKDILAAKAREFFTGRKLTLDQRKQRSERYRGSGSHFWLGGVAKKNKLERERLEYRLWRQEVFKRDGYTCVQCKEKGGRLEADHIKPFALYPELRLIVENGRTLCKECHKLTATYGWKAINNLRNKHGLDGQRR